jgi:hypothetical protein
MGTVQLLGAFGRIVETTQGRLVTSRGHPGPAPRGLVGPVRTGDTYLWTASMCKYVTRGTRRFAHVSRMFRDVSRDSRRAEPEA